ncbi:MAG: amidohydrolase family protein, partial [Alphaproteobacteria bacterium]
KPYPQSPSGMPGVQTLLPVMLDHVHRGRLTLERLVDLASHGPQRIYNIASKGRLVVGYDADIVLVDLKAKRVVAREWIESKSGWSPFEGMELTGWPVATILRGQIVMREGQRLGVPMGKPARFLDTRGG